MTRKQLLIILVVTIGFFTFNTVSSQTAQPAKTKPTTTNSKPTNQATQGKQSPVSNTATPAKPAIKPVAGNVNNASNDITGYWLTANKSTILNFYKVGDKYNGKAVWSKMTDKNGKPLKDVNNPDKSKHNNLLVGTDFIYGLKYNPATDTYEGGKIYQPQTGRTFNCKAILNKEKNELSIIGGVGFISKTVVWTRTTGVPGK